MKRLVGISGFLLISGCLYGTDVKKIVHRAPQDEQALEVGVLEVYFSQAPAMENNRMTPDEGDHIMEIRLADVDIKPVDIVKLQEVRGTGYTVSTGKKNSASTITISYDPAQISIVCTPVVSINMEHGIVIRFFDQSLLRKISTQERPILSVAYLT